jgi:hypothetical protein
MAAKSFSSPPDDAVDRSAVSMFIMAFSSSEGGRESQVPFGASCSIMPRRRQKIILVVPTLLLLRINLKESSAALFSGGDNENVLLEKNVYMM